MEPLRIVGALLVLIGTSLPAWAEGPGDRLVWASHQLYRLAQSPGEHPLRAILVAAALAVGLVAACVWVRRSHPRRRDEIPHR